MPEPHDFVTQECTACSALIDITDEEPLGLMQCPTCGESLRVRRLFGPFEPVEVLGAGGMGAVYRAVDVTLNRSVALKLLRREYSQNPEVMRQFEHEAAVTAHINHPNVVKVYSTGTDHGVFYIAMELVSKGSLDDLMTLQGKIGEAQVLEVGIQVAQGLRAAYRQGLIHRDIKPGNILFADAHHAKMVDFGLAAPIDDAGQVGGEVWGTPYYVAPEKLDQPPSEDFRSDIYSLGGTLFHALAGRPPYEAKDASMVALKHLKSQPVSLATFAPEVSTRTAFVINKTLSKDPAQRQNSYEELIEQLEFARNQLMMKGAQRGKAAAAKRRVVMEDTGHQRALSIITLLVLLALGGGSYFVYQNRDKLFPKKDDGLSPGQRALQGSSVGRSRYEEARTMLSIGKAAEAAVAFRKVEAEANLPQPLLNWATLHAGLASVLAGKLDEAKPDFEKLAQREPISQDPEDLKLSAFFQKMAKAMTSESPENPEQSREFERRNYEAIAGLLLGAKNWELGEFESALEFLSDFESSNPEQPDEWIAEYQPLAVNYEKSFEKYKGFNDLVKSINDPAKAKVELPKMKTMLAELNLQGALAKKGRSTIRRMEQEVADYEEEQKNMEREMIAADEKTLTEAEEKVKALVEGFKFDQARDGVSAAPAITPEGKERKKGLINKYDWLATFKSQLGQDLSTVPFPSGLLKKNGGRVPGTVQDATETMVVVKAGPGTISIPWEEVSFESLVAMAQSYCRVDLPADRLGDRLWQIGVFAAAQNRPAEATKYFGLAIQKKPSYKAQLKVFPQVPPPA